MTTNDKFRQSVLEVLKLLSSRTLQLEYKLKNPTVNVALELLCLWFNELCNPEQHLFRRSFTVEELKLIQKFNDYYAQCKSKVPETIEQLHEDSDWKIIMDEAKKLFIILDKTPG